MEETAPVTPPHVVGPLRLHPFHALMLTPSSVGDPASARMFARPYREVSGRLAQWIGSGRVRWDDQPGLYLHEYTSGGITVRGLVGALDLTHSSTQVDPSHQAVFAHEGVHPEQVSELAERMAEMGVNPAPILLVHRGPGTLRERIRSWLELAPDLVYADRAGQVQRVWALRDPRLVATVAAELADSQALIADGHHRYAAYLRLADRHRGTPWDRGLAMLVDQSDTPLWLGAIHRFLAGQSLEALLVDLAELPGVTTRICSRSQALEQLGPHTMVMTDDVGWATVDVERGQALAVTTLESELLPALGIPRRSVSFHHTVEDAVRQARSRTGVCVLMPSPAFDAVVETAFTGHLLPEKATSFQPKPSLGVLMRNLNDE